MCHTIVETCRRNLAGLPLTHAPTPTSGSSNQPPTGDQSKHDPAMHMQARSPQGETTCTSHKRWELSVAHRLLDQRQQTTLQLAVPGACIRTPHCALKLANVGTGQPNTMPPKRFHTKCVISVTATQCYSPTTPTPDETDEGTAHVLPATPTPDQTDEGTATRTGSKCILQARQRVCKRGIRNTK
jgi:hypothetical protein